MKIFKYIKAVWRFLIDANVIKTIIFNFRYLSFRTACRLPIHLYGRVELCNDVSGGVVEFSSKQRPHFGAWSIGNDCMRIADNLHPDITIIELSGKLILGTSGRIRNGVILRIHGITRIEENVNIGYKCKIICKNMITIGANTQIAWECQFFDTNFHYIIKDDKYINRTNGSLFIGSYCWIGNRVTINKDSYIADYCIIASYSLVNKSTKCEPKCILAGIPARKVANNCQRIFEDEQWQLRAIIEDYFSNNPNSMTYEISK